MTGVAGAEPISDQPTGWQQYTALLRRLDQLRLDQLRLDRQADGDLAGQPTGSDTAVVAVRTELARVETALDDQADQLERLARLLRLGRLTLPRSDRDGPAATPAAARPDDHPTRSTHSNGEAGPGPAQGDPFALLRGAVTQAQRSAELAGRADRRARQPWLLPGLGVATRNLLVYLFWAMLGLLVQYLVVAGDPTGGSGLVVLVALPAVGFVAGWTTITRLGRPRLPSQTERVRFGRAPLPDPNRRSVRLGLTVCFLAFPVAFVVLLVNARLQR